MGTIQLKRTTRVLSYKEDKPEVWKAQQISYPPIKVEALIKEISHSEGVNETMVQAVIIALLNRISHYVTIGHAVNVAPLGTFKPRIRTIVTQTKEDANTATVKNVVCQFMPAKGFREQIKAINIEMDKPLTQV